jgi:hypothetical protein
VAGICIAVALSSVVLARLPDRVTLSWEHSVEKTRWEEDYALVEGRLILEEARVQGTGAGMEIPDGASFEGGTWHYHPELPPLPEVRFTNSLLPRGYDICFEGRCVRLRELIGDDQRSLTLLPCDAALAEAERRTRPVPIGADRRAPVSAPP